LRRIRDAARDRNFLASGRRGTEGVQLRRSIAAPPSARFGELDEYGCLLSKGSRVPCNWFTKLLCPNMHDAVVLKLLSMYDTEKFGEINEYGVSAVV
jgi:hypothetical protein